jgi:circadian clock protein KaiC
MKRITTGLSKLDSLVEGGFPPNTVILVSGGAGTGKTLLGLNFVINGASNEKSCFVSFNEGEKDLLRACECIKSLNNVKNKNLIIKTINLGRDIDVKEFIEIVEQYPEFDRLVIDNLNKLLLFAENKKDYRYQLCNLVRYLREKVSCTLLVCETEGDKIDTGSGEAFECDGVLHLSFLEFEEKPLRTLKIDKLRYTSFEPRVAHEFVIDSKGLRLSKRKVI